MLKPALRQPQAAAQEIRRQAIALLPRKSLNRDCGLRPRCRQPGVPTGIYRADHNEAGDQHAGEDAESPEQASQTAAFAPSLRVVYDCYTLRFHVRRPAR